MDDFTVKTFLRPDFYQYFPKFSNIDLANRSSWADFTKATLLGLANIERGLKIGLISPNLVKLFLRSSKENQVTQLMEVLLSVGISRRAAKAVRNVPRHFYCPAWNVQFAYIDASLFFDQFSCLSAPSIVALMLDRINFERGMKILDVGCGSCYHAHCASEMCSNDCEIYGIDINSEFLELGKLALAKSGLKTVQIKHGNALNGWPGARQGQFDVMYGAVALGKTIPQKLIYQLKDGGTIQFTRPLTRKEFFSEPPKSWLRTTFASYSNYYRSWRKFGCLVTGQRQGAQIIELERLYDVTFVPFQKQATISKKWSPKVDNLQFLRRSLD